MFFAAFYAVAGPWGGTRRWRVVHGTCGVSGWYRLSGTTGDYSEIIAVESVKGPATMTVLPTDHAVKFEGGGITWTKIS